MKKLGILMLLLVTMTVVLVGGGCSGDNDDTGALELKIGAIVDLTGQGSDSTGQMADGMVAATDWINDNGGITIDGQQYTIKFIQEDGQMTAEGAVAAANKLVYDHGVDFIIGSSLPFVKKSVANVTEPAQVLVIDLVGLGTPDEIGPDWTYTFHTMPTLGTHSSAWAMFHELYPDVKTVVATSPDDAPALYDMESNIRHAEANGFDVIDEEVYAFGESDFYPMWTKILSVGPDAIAASAGYPTWMGSILKQGRELGFEGPFFLSTTGGDIYTVREVAGVEYATDYVACTPDLKSDEMTDKIKEIAAIVEADQGVALTMDYLTGWEGLWCMVQAIEEAQSIDPTEVRDSFEQTSGIETPFGMGTMGGQETVGINHVIVRPCALSRLMDGEVNFIKWFEVTLN